MSFREDTLGALGEYPNHIKAFFCEGVLDGHMCHSVFSNIFRWLVGAKDEMF